MYVFQIFVIRFRLDGCSFEKLGFCILGRDFLFVEWVRVLSCRTSFGLLGTSIDIWFLFFRYIICWSVIIMIHLSVFGDFSALLNC